MTVCFFTASGNCLDVARRIGGTLLSIPKLMRQETIEIEDDAVGIACPVYAGEMPMMVREFMTKAKIKTEYFFFVYTFGMSCGAAFAHAELAAREAGLTLNYVNAVHMVDNYLPIFDMADQIRTLPEKNVDGQLERLCAEIAAGRQRPAVITAKTKLQMAMFSNRLAKSILKKDTAQHYIVNNACIRCGICVRVCPANNITVTENGVLFSDHCEVCYACLHTCPRNAIHLSLEANSVRFRNEHVTLQDIIGANE